MYKKIWTYLFLILISVQYVYQLGVTSHFVWNKEKISTEICENRSQPELKCNGKCYLAKQLNVVDSNDDQPMDLSSNSIELINLWSGVHLVQQEKLLFQHFKNEKIDFVNIHHGLTLVTDILQPPQRIKS